jgi:FdhD protein
VTAALTARIRSYRDGEARDRADRVAHEAPLEIQVQGVACTVVMRTPGDDPELALGFLVTERVIGAADDVVSLRHCTAVADPESEESVLRVILREGVSLPIERLRRNVYASSSCGLCGKATIEAALACGAPVRAPLRVTPELLYALPDRMRAAQAAFDETGGLHAAGLFSATGELMILREDVGRHNAVDKVVGAALRRGLPLAEHLLLVSGRVGFEIVQKAAAAGLPLLAGLSAPTSLATRFGEALGVTVVGFLRGRAMNVYTHAERIQE